MSRMVCSIVVAVHVMAAGTGASFGQDQAADATAQLTRCQELQAKADLDQLGPLESEEWWLCVTKPVPPGLATSPDGLMALQPPPDFRNEWEAFETDREFEG